MISYKTIKVFCVYLEDTHELYENLYDFTERLCVTGGIEMSTSKEFLNYVLEQLSGLDGITYRQMMGEYIVYYYGKIAAYICDNRLLVKPVPSAVKMMSEPVLEPPYQGAKDMLLVENTDDKEFLTELFKAMYDELPAPKKKNKK